MITDKALIDAFKIDGDLARQWVEPLNIAMDIFEINTPKRQCAFLAQIAHESGCFKYVREIWGPTNAQNRYDGRKDLGNTQFGDGSRYRGRGLIQITGRANYAKAYQSLNKLGLNPPDFEQNPTLLEDKKWAAISAADFWKRHGLNEMADRDYFTKITKAINGGTNGLEDRKDKWVAIKRVMGIK